MGKYDTLIIVGALGAAAYFLIYKPMQATGQAIGGIPASIAGAPAAAITGTESFLIAQTKGLTDLIAGMFGTASAQYQQVQQSLLDIVKEQAKQAAQPLPSQPQFQPSLFGGTAVVAGAAPTASIRYPTTVITAFATPQATAARGTTPFGYSATNSAGQVIATGFTSMASAKAYERAVGVRY